MQYSTWPSERCQRVSEIRQFRESPWPKYRSLCDVWHDLVLQRDRGHGGIIACTVKQKDRVEQLKMPGRCIGRLRDSKKTVYLEAFDIVTVLGIRTSIAVVVRTSHAARDKVVEKDPSAFHMPKEE